MTELKIPPGTDENGKFMQFTTRGIAKTDPKSLEQIPF